jgi:hypothetical protein
MPSLSELLADAATVEVKWRTRLVVVDYLPGKVTGAWLAAWGARLKGIAGDDEFMPAHAELLADVLTGWDITGDDKAPLPVTVEAVLRLPHGLARRIEAAIVADQQASGEASGTSPVGLGGAKSRTGTS